ncbi:MAG: co-chaperone HscB [Gammaproteobacteria bacterium]|nr:co-chaperone HscB [Gammaproteobacteria bacterium]
MQPGVGKNYFELFGLPARFDVDLPGLNNRYRSLQQQFHPDRFASGSEQERRMAMELTASINEGLRVLRNPLARARYLLELAGISVNDETDTAMNPAFLMEQMEWREQLDAVRSGPADDAGPVLQSLSKDVNNAFNRRVDQLRTELNNDDLSAARTHVRELQFLDKLKMQIEEIEESLF